MRSNWGPDRALYGISVAAELTGVNPQMLRAYEAKGLLQPHRTEGGTRRYSGNDLDRIHQITSLLDEGLNLTGIAHVLALQAETRRLRTELDRLRQSEQATDDTENSAPDSNRSTPKNRGDPPPPAAHHRCPAAPARLLGAPGRGQEI